MEGNLKSLGWYLSKEGIDQCLKQRGGSRPEDVAAVALEMDLRSIGAPSLPVIGGKKKQELGGPLVLQLQKVKNVALSPSKQNSQSSKRFLRLELTDGHKNISAVELQGPIVNLSLDTPPGTKIKIKGKVEVANSFLLLSRSCVDILGGRVEGLLKKWHATKAVPDNLGRESGTNEGGPPQFVKFGKSTGGKASVSSASSASSKQAGSSAQKPRQPSSPRETSTREKMELPSSYFADGTSKRKVDTACDDSARHAPGSVKHKDSLASGMRNLSMKDSQVVDIEALVPSSSGGSKTNSGSQSIGSTKTNLTNLATGSKSRGTSGPFTQRSQDDGDRGGRGRGRGRGRHREEDSDDYRQEKRKDFMLSDFFNQREQQRQRPSGGQQHVDTLPDEWPELRTEHSGHTGSSDRPSDRGELRDGGHTDKLAGASNWKSGNEGRGRGRGRGMSRNGDGDTLKENNWNFSERSSYSGGRDESNDSRRVKESGGRQGNQLSEHSYNYSSKFDRKSEVNTKVTGANQHWSAMSQDSVDHKGKSASHMRGGSDRTQSYWSNEQHDKSRGGSHRDYYREREKMGSDNRRREDYNERTRHSQGRGQHGDNYRGHGGTEKPSYGSNEDRRGSSGGWSEARIYESHSTSRHGAAHRSQRDIFGSSRGDTSGSLQYEASDPSRYRTMGSSQHNTTGSSQYSTTHSSRHNASNKQYDALDSLQHDVSRSSHHGTSGTTQHAVSCSSRSDASGSTQRESANSSEYDKHPSQGDVGDSFGKHGKQSSGASRLPSRTTTTTEVPDDGSHWDFLYLSNSSRPATATKGKVNLF